MGSYNDFFTSGMEDFSKDDGFIEPFSYNGNTYKGVFNIGEFEVELENGGFKSVMGALLVVLKKDLNYVKPNNGTTLTKLPCNGDTFSSLYRIQTVGVDTVTYTIKLVDINK